MGKTQSVGEEFSRIVDAERWILTYIFGDTDHLKSSENNLRVTQDGRHAWFDYAQGADNFFFLGPEVNKSNILRAQEDNIVPIVLQKLHQLEMHISSDPAFVTSIFERITRNFPNKKMGDMFYEGKGKTPADFQRQLLGRIRSAIQHFQALPEAY